MLIDMWDLFLPSPSFDGEAQWRREHPAQSLACRVG